MDMDKDIEALKMSKIAELPKPVISKTDSDFHKTKEEAQKMRYGMGQHSYTEGKCAASTDTSQKWQCIRKAGHGPDGLYCWQHARMIEKYGKNA
jgi:hypothetical protein